MTRTARQADAAARGPDGRLRANITEWEFDDMPLVAEPGRVVVARAFSLIVRVLLRKGRRLYINDGIWASLSDSWTGKITLPARFIPDPARRIRKGKAENVVPFKVCGATCDSVDILTAVLAAGNGRYRRLDRDRPYRRLFAVAQDTVQRFLSRRFRRGDDAV
jgi:diaminopimelate decarboxylase